MSRPVNTMQRNEKKTPKYATQSEKNEKKRLHCLTNVKSNRTRDKISTYTYHTYPLSLTFLALYSHFNKR